METEFIKHRLKNDENNWIIFSNANLKTT